MTYVAVVAWDAAGRVSIYQDFDTEAEADAHVERVAERHAGAFAAPRPEGNPWDWRVEEGALAFDPPVAPVTPEAIAARRYQAEVAGTLWEGRAVHTDRESQAKITAAALMVMREQWPTDGAPWKFKDGFAMLTPQDVSDMADHVAAHVATCYTVEAMKLADLAAGEPVDLDAGWPE